MSFSGIKLGESLGLKPGLLATGQQAEISSKISGTLYVFAFKHFDT